MPARGSLIELNSHQRPSASEKGVLSEVPTVNSPIHYAVGSTGEEKAA